MNGKCLLCGLTFYSVVIFLGACDIQVYQCFPFDVYAFADISKKLLQSLLLPLFCRDFKALGFTFRSYIGQFFASLRQARVFWEEEFSVRKYLHKTCLQASL